MMLAWLRSSDKINVPGPASACSTPALAMNPAEKNTASS